MASITTERPKIAEAVVIAPYGSRLHSWLRRRRVPLLLAFAGFCFVYGFLFALTAPLLIVAFAAPVAILGLMVIWALPDLKSAPTQLLTSLLMAFIVASFAWPNYLAIAIPGLPWITLQRLSGIPMALVFLVCLSVSRDFRSQLAEILETTPRIWRMLGVFVALQFLTIAFSTDKSASLQKAIVWQMSWTAVFAISCFAFVKPRRLETYLFVIWGLGLLVSGIGYWESLQRAVLWRGHIPSFLKIDDADNILKDSVRSATGLYRVKSIFTTPLGLAEFLALIAPFNIHIAASRYNIFVRLLSAASVGFYAYIIHKTDARLGTVGLIVGALGYLFLWSVTNWIRKKGGALITSAIVFSYPMLLCAAVGATFFVGRVRKMVWGSGAESASNTARHDQITRGIPIVLKAPWGHGPGQSGASLGYYSHGFLTIDNYYLLIALEYGVVGFCVYYGIILMTIWNASKYMIQYRHLKDPEFEMFIPLMASLAAFFVIKAVFSQQDNHQLVFMMLGMVTALAYRAKATAKDTVPPIARTIRRSRAVARVR